MNPGQATGDIVSALKNSLYAYGPLVVTMYVYGDFQNYAGGIYSYSGGNLEGGHAIELIGYDDNNQCFIAKNSWGTAWGESATSVPYYDSTMGGGFFRIAYSQVNNQVSFGGAGGTIA